MNENGRVPSPSDTVERGPESGPLPLAAEKLVARDMPRGGDAARGGPHGYMRLTLDRSRERLRTGHANLDPFDIADIMRQYAPTNGDPRKGNAANEIDFNWKRYEVFGKRDFSELRGYHDQGWREVQHSDFPGRFAPVGAQGPVVVKDLILMERPMSLTVSARNEEIDAATRAMQVNQTNMTTTPEGQAPRMVIADRSTREAIPIPE